MEPYGAPWLQRVAINGKSDGRGSAENKPKPLPPGCDHEEYMVRRGPTVRVRQRALQKPRNSGPFVSPGLARSPACGRYGAFMEPSGRKGPLPGAPRVAADEPMPERSRYHNAKSSETCLQRGQRLRAQRSLGRGTWSDGAGGAVGVVQSHDRAASPRRRRERRHLTPRRSRCTPTGRASAPRSGQ
jgi:hypothetical protein